ncbi:MAG: hypothetical protein RSE41_07755 [Clostridia bacterium]
MNESANVPIYVLAFLLG